MSRDWRLRVEDILAAAERAIRFVGELDLAAFKAHERTAAAVLHQIFLIGETAARLPEEIRSRAPDIPWEEIIGMRNIITHGYFEVDLSPACYPRAAIRPARGPSFEVAGPTSPSCPGAFRT